MLSSGLNSWNPMFKSNSIGIRHQFSSFSTYHPNLGLNSSETMQVMELNGRWNIKNKLFLSALLPFVYNQQNIDATQKIITSGISDIRLQAIASVWEINPDTGKLGHLLQLGMGFKLPNASYNAIQHQSQVSEMMQLGTGAVEFQFLAQYILNWNAFKSIWQASYFIPTENSNEYQFGKRSTFQATLLREFEIRKNNKLLFGGGLGIDWSEKNKRYGYEILYSGHTILNAQLQASLFFSRFSISAQFARPIFQKMNDGATQNNFLTNLSFQFFI
jgi:hypothetical protein